jgi:hypothetical protein
MAIIVIPFQKGTWSAVLITAPADINLGDSPQPFGYEIPQGRADSIRALVFAKNRVTSVQFHIGEGSTWHGMQKSAINPLWTGFWDTASYAPGLHTVEVRARGSSSMVERIETIINPALCIVDADRDGDVDGRDLAELVGDMVPDVVQNFAADFGRTACP